MSNASKSYPELERLLTNKETTKKEIDDFLWLVEHAEYEERPADIKTFINSPAYMNAKNECWDSIRDDLAELFQGYDNPGMQWKYNEAVFDEGIGAGKSYKSSVIITYLVYRVLILKDPHKFLHLAYGSGIYFMNMSIRSDQARKIVFGEIAQRINNSPWFREKNYLPNPNIKSELQLPKNITIVPGNSKETFPLGFNLLAAVMDEAAFYTETETHDVAEEMFNALYSRIKNRFGNKGMLVMISSPRYIDDFIERKMTEAKTQPHIFARRKATWESKPKYLYSGETIEIEGYSIPVEYKTEALRNFDRFKRDVMAIPSLALEPYFKQWALVEQAVDLNIEIPIDKYNGFKDSFRGKPGFTYYGHIDLSLTTDATGISFCHKEGDKIIVDLIMKIEAAQGKEIDIAEVRAVVYELKARGFSIGKCSFDSFQSASSIQEFNKMGINSERLSIDKDLACYETLKEAVNTGKVKFYRNEDFLMELRRLELIEGKRIDHPKGGGKDLADAVAGAVYNCITAPEFSFWFSGGSRQKTKEEQALEDATRTTDGLVPYNFWQGRRPY